jgi:hypothetical protein
MSETPRTDTFLVAWDVTPDSKMLIEHFRQFEIELNVANQHIKRLKEAGTYAINTLQPKDPSNLSFLQSQAIKEWNDVKENK